MSNQIDPALVDGNRTTVAGYAAQHFLWSVDGGVATITLNRPERKNPLTFASYAELRDLFRTLRYATDVHAVVLHGAGDNFCSGGDVHEIIGPLVALEAPELLMFTRMILAGLIDTGLVNGAGALAGATTRGLSIIPRRVQSGNIRSYAGWLALGAAAILVVMIFGRSLWVH